MSRRITAAIPALLAAALAAGLAGCGKLGSLERPGPMFGHASAQPAAGERQQDPNRPVQTVDPRDSDQQSTPR